MYKLNKEDIEKMEQIGDSRQGAILHVLTKGGLSMIIAKSIGGELKILASGAHPGIARYKAEQVEKSINWHSDLFKSESQSEYEKLSKQSHNDHAHWEALSTPENHHKLAQWHSHNAGLEAERHIPEDSPNLFEERHNKNMKILYHADEALKHYKMAGMDHKAAMEAHSKNMADHKNLDVSYKPLDSYNLELGWRRNRSKENPGQSVPVVSGLGYNWTK
jgi:hypothetical protein